MASLTLSTCFYAVWSKFPPQTYTQWMAHLFYIVREFNLVVYTDELGSSFLPANVHNPRIRVVIIPVEQFFTHAYKRQWIETWQRQPRPPSWQLNMLWNEKAFFVQNTMRKNYFPASSFYGWCDIGYFRNRMGLDIPLKYLLHWGNSNALYRVHPTKINFGCIEKNPAYVDHLYEMTTHTSFFPIPPGRPVICGGFFVAPSFLVDWWAETIDSVIRDYFQHNAPVKDDQTIAATAIFRNPEKVVLHKENKPPLDAWFMFQRILQ